MILSTIHFSIISSSNSSVTHNVDQVNTPVRVQVMDQMSSSSCYCPPWKELAVIDDVRTKTCCPCVMYACFANYFAWCCNSDVELTQETCCLSECSCCYDYCCKKK